MAIQLPPYTLGLAALVLVSVTVLAYRALLPQPIPGIPYKKKSARRILGDAPDVSSDYGCGTKHLEADEKNSFWNGVQRRKKSGATSESLPSTSTHP